jgi:hypothetical protein
MDDWDDGSKEDSIRYVSVLGVCCQKAQAGHGLSVAVFTVPGVKCMCVCSRGRWSSLPIDL